MAYLSGRLQFDAQVVGGSSNGRSLTPISSAACFCVTGFLLVFLRGPPRDRAPLIRKELEGFSYGAEAGIVRGNLVGRRSPKFLSHFIKRRNRPNGDMVAREMMMTAAKQGTIRQRNQGSGVYSQMTIAIRTPLRATVGRRAVVSSSGQHR